MGSESGEDLIVGFTFEGSLDFGVLLAGSVLLGNSGNRVSETPCVAGMVLL